MQRTQQRIVASGERPLILNCRGEMRLCATCVVTRRTFYSVSTKVLSGASPETELEMCAAYLLPPGGMHMDLAAKKKSHPYETGYNA